MSNSIAARCMHNAKTTFWTVVKSVSEKYTIYLTHLIRFRRVPSYRWCVVPDESKNVSIETYFGNDFTRSGESGNCIKWRAKVLNRSLQQTYIMCITAIVCDGARLFRILLKRLLLLDFTRKCRAVAVDKHHDGKIIYIKGEQKYLTLLFFS